jgi:hypothetical protein
MCVLKNTLPCSDNFACLSKNRFNMRACEFHTQTCHFYTSNVFVSVFGFGTLFITVQDLLELKNIILEVELSNELINVNENVLEHQKYKHISEVPTFLV